MDGEESEIFYVPSLSDCLFTAVHDGNATEIKRLISLGCDVNHSDPCVRWKATHAACCYGQSEILKLLLHAGGVLDDECSSAFRATPLIYALEHRHEACVRVLIENGACVNARNHRQESVIALLAPFCFDIDLYKTIIGNGHKVSTMLVEGDVLDVVPYRQTIFREQIIDLLERAGAFSIRRFVVQQAERKRRLCPERLEKTCVDYIRAYLLECNLDSNLVVISRYLEVPSGIRKLITEGLVAEVSCCYDRSTYQSTKMSDQDFVEMKPVTLEHPLTNPGTRSIDEYSRAKHLALVSMMCGCVFNATITHIQHKLIHGASVNGIELHQFEMHAEIVLSDEEILMADALIDAVGVGSSGDVPLAGTSFITDKALHTLQRNPRFETRLNPDDTSQVGLLHLDSGKCVLLRKQVDRETDNTANIGLIGAPQIIDKPTVPSSEAVGVDESELPFADDLREFLDKASSLSREGNMSSVEQDLPTREPGVVQEIEMEEDDLLNDDQDVGVSGESDYDLKSEAMTGEKSKDDEEEVVSFGVETSVGETSRGSDIQVAEQKRIEAEQELEQVESERNIEEMKRKRAQEEQTVLEDEIRVAEQKRISTERDILRVEEEKKDEQLKLIAIEEEKLRLEGVKRHAEEQCIESTQELERIKSEKLNTEVKIEKAVQEKTELELSKITAEQKVEEYEKEIKSIDEMNKDLKVKLKASEDAKRDLQEAKQLAQKKLDDTEKENQRIRGEHEKVKQMIDECDAENKRLEGLKQSAEDNLLQLQLANTRLENQKKEFLRQVNASESEKVRLKGEIASVETKIEKCELEKKKLLSEKDEAERQLKESEKLKLQVQSELRDKEKQHNEAVNVNQRLADDRRAASLKRLENDKERMRQEEGQRLAQLKNFEHVNEQKRADDMRRSLDVKPGASNAQHDMDVVEDAQLRKMAELQNAIKAETALEEQDKVTRQMAEDKEKAERSQRIETRKRQIQQYQEELMQIQKRRRTSNEGVDSASRTAMASPKPIASDKSNLPTSAVTRSEHSDIDESGLQLDAIFGGDSDKEKPAEEGLVTEYFDKLRSQASAKSKLMKELDGILTLRVVEPNKKKIQTNLAKDKLVVSKSLASRKERNTSFLNIIGTFLPSLADEPYEQRHVQVREQLVAFITENFSKFTNEWLKRYCTDKKCDVFTWISEVQRSKIEMDAAMIVCTSAFLKRPITIISAGKKWTTDAKSESDIVMVFAGDKSGDKIFLPAEVESSTELDEIFDSLLHSSSFVLDAVFGNSSPAYDGDTDDYDSASILQASSAKSASRGKTKSPPDTYPVQPDMSDVEHIKLEQHQQTRQSSRKRKRANTSTSAGNFVAKKATNFDDDNGSVKGASCEFQPNVALTRLDRALAKDKCAKTQNVNKVVVTPTAKVKTSKASVHKEQVKAKSSVHQEQVKAKSESKDNSTKPEDNSSITLSSESKDKRNKTPTPSTSHDSGTGRNEYMIKCEICDERFENERKLAVHSSSHSGRMKCFMCIQGFDVREDLQNHLAKVHNKPYPCYVDNCNHACQTTNGLKLHMKAKHGYTPQYECTACDRVFKTEGAKTNHPCKGVKKEDREEELCLHCDMNFPNRNELKQHLASAHGIVKIVCPKCQSEYDDEAALVRHMGENSCELIVNKRRKSGVKKTKQ